MVLGYESDDFLFELGLAFELRSWLHALQVHDCVDTVDVGVLFTSSLSSNQGRLRFRNATLDEFCCCINSACQLFTFCMEHGLKRSAYYLHPLLLLASQQIIDRGMDGDHGVECQKDRKSLKKHVIATDLVDNSTVACY